MPHSKEIDRLQAIIDSPKTKLIEAVLAMQEIKRIRHNQYPKGITEKRPHNPWRGHYSPLTG